MIRHYMMSYVKIVNKHKVVTVLVAVAFLLVIRSADADSRRKRGGAVDDPTGSDPSIGGAFGDLVEVSEVLLDVVVVGADGLPAGGLAVDDFLVEEDGHEVAVTGLSTYVTSYDTLEPEAKAATPWSRYLILLFHDTANGARYGQRYVRRQIEAGAQSQRWVMEEMLGGDWVAVVSYGRSLRVHADFSQDRFELARAIELAAIDEPPAPDERPRRARRSRSGMIPSLVRGLPEAETPARDVHEALALLAEATGHLVGRKNMVLFSTGFGREIGVHRMAVVDPLKYRRLEPALNDNNVAVYPIDLTPGSERRGQRAFLDRLAFDTGGVYFDGLGGFEDALDRVGSSNTLYYLLSYSTEHAAGEIGYQKVSVSTRNPAFRVFARTGYRYGR